MILKTTQLYLYFALFFSASVFSHEGQEARIKFWKEYYNPKVEVTQEKIPSIKIFLHKTGPFFQLQTKVENFKFTPESDMKDNNSWTGYGKLYINGKFITRVYNERLFLKSLPVGNNEIKVILSSNMDHDVALNKELVSDQIYMRFPEYNFAEARAEAHSLFTRCEFSDNGKARTKALAAKGLKASESSEYLQCTYDSNKSIEPFTKEMTRAQKGHYDIVNTSLEERIGLWKSYENKEININEAREKNLVMENSVDVKMKELMCTLTLSKDDSCK